VEAGISVVSIEACLSGNEQLRHRSFDAASAPVLEPHLGHSPPEHRVILSAAARSGSRRTTFKLLVMLAEAVGASPGYRRRSKSRRRTVAEPPPISFAT
jgi:hypothetical protein